MYARCAHIVIITFVLAIALYPAAAFAGDLAAANYEDESVLTQWNGTSTPGYAALVYNANGGSGMGPAPSFVRTSAQASVAGCSYAAPAGMIFTGWNTAANGSGATYMPGANITVSTDTTLYAQWRTDAPPVTFNANGGSGYMGTYYVGSSLPTVLPQCAYTRSGYTFSGWATSKSGPVAYNDGGIIMTSDPITLYAVWELDRSKAVYLFRLYNPKFGEHLYTLDVNEVAVLTSSSGWRYEGIAWAAPIISSKPVYRMYNKKTGDHHYTADENERKTLKKIGWRDEGVAWYSADNDGVPVYRVYNPYSVTRIGTHHYTKDKHEVKVLVNKYKWEREGIGWYALA